MAFNTLYQGLDTTNSQDCKKEKNLSLLTTLFHQSTEMSFKYNTHSTYSPLEPFTLLTITGRKHQSTTAKDFTLCTNYHFSLFTTLLETRGTQCVRLIKSLDREAAKTHTATPVSAVEPRHGLTQGRCRGVMDSFNVTYISVTLRCYSKGFTEMPLRYKGFHSTFYIFSTRTS